MEILETYSGEDKSLNNIVLYDTPSVPEFWWARSNQYVKFSQLAQMRSENIYHYHIVQKKALPLSNP